MFAGNPNPGWKLTKTSHAKTQPHKRKTMPCNAEKEKQLKIREEEQNRKDIDLKVREDEQKNKELKEQRRKNRELKILEQNKDIE